MFIYKITNAVNGKIYIGQHKGSNLKKYFQTKISDALHQRGGRSHLFNAIRKHGRENFSIEPLAEVHGDMPKVVLNNLETFCISILGTQNSEIGYNICRGGEGFTGPHSQAAKDKVGAFWQGKKRSPENRAAISTAKKGILRPDLRKSGLKAVESGQLDRIRPAAWLASAQWKKDHREEHLANVRKAGRVIACRRWNVERGKPCVCGKHG